MLKFGATEAVSKEVDVILRGRNDNTQRAGVLSSVLHVAHTDLLYVHAVR